MKLLRNRKGACLPYDARDYSALPGDYMVDMWGRAWRLEESSGRNKRDAGDLTPRKISPPAGFSRAVLKGGKIFWVRKSEER